MSVDMTNPGPIHTSFNDYRMPMEEDFIKACYEVSKTKNTLVDACSGDHMGFYSSLAAIDRTGNPGTRRYAATEYLKPNLGRPNLKVWTSAWCPRQCWTTGMGRNLVVRVTLFRWQSFPIYHIR